MNRKLATFVVALAVGASLAVPAAGAGSGNTVSDAGTEANCGFGSCFAPLFNAQGDSVVYKGGAARRVEFADCCAPGDKYKVIVKDASGNKSVTIFTSAGALNADCSTGPYANSSAAELAEGATQVKMVALRLPGGTPAGAYVRMSASNWRQTVGADSCGF